MMHASFRRLVGCAALAACSALHAAEWNDYTLGQGLPLGDYLFSGYVNIVTEVPRSGPWEVDLDDVSLFFAGRVNRWFNPFVEAEISSLTIAEERNGSGEKAHFVRERIYDDVHIDDDNTLRVGKILAPVGEWNLVHAAPLVPITTQPLTTTRGFANYSSGLSWIHETPSASMLPNWQVYAQAGREWLPRPQSVADRQYRNVFGGHLDWNLGLNERFGLSAQHGEMINSGETYTLFGANVQKKFGRIMIGSEATTADWSGSSAPRSHDVERGIYVLADYSVTQTWHAIVEGEYFQDHQVADTSRNLLVGVAYRPRPAVVWKAEYVQQMGVSSAIPTGLQASFAVLF
jgi:hypothetical protein